MSQAGRGVTRSPAIAVVTPTKNRLALLCETIDSVVGQTFQDWEMLVVDDGSDDGTAEEVARRAEKDARIRFLARTGPLSGANVCRNLGLRSSRAPLLVFLDSDDLLRPDSLRRRVEVMARNADLDFAVFRAGVFKDVVGDQPGLYHAQSKGDDLLRFLSLECPWQTTGPVWRRTFLEGIGGFDDGLRSMQDLELHVRALAAGAAYSCFPDVDHDIRGQDDPLRTSTRHFNDPAFIRAAEAVRDKLETAVAAGGLLTWSRQRALVGLSFGAAQSWVRAGRPWEAQRAWRCGCRGDPALWLVGSFMLCLEALNRRHGGLLARVVNRWKGWARFRQEPAVLVVSETRGARC